MVSPEFELNPLEFQQMCKRIVYAFVPEYEHIDTARELRNRIMQGMRAANNRRAFGFVKGGGPELLLEKATEGKRWAQTLLGWIKPLKPVLKVLAPVDKWRIIGLRRRIYEHEWVIVYTRQKLRELGVKLVEPYPA